MKRDQENGLKSDLLDACRKLLLEKGYRGCSLRKIAAEAGVTATSIYLHFENKDDLIHSVMDQSIEELNDRLERVARGPGEAVQKLENLAREYVNFALEHPREYQVIYRVNSDEMARYPREKFRKARRGYRIVGEVIEQGVAEGSVEESRPVLAAYVLWAQLHGVLSVMFSRRLDSRIERELFIEEAVERILQGYRLRSAMEMS